MVLLYHFSSIFGNPYRSRTANTVAAFAMAATLARFTGDPELVQLRIKVLYLRKIYEISRRHYQRDAIANRSTLRRCGGAFNIGPTLLNRLAFRYRLGRNGTFNSGGDANRRSSPVNARVSANQKTTIPLQKEQTHPQSDDRRDFSIQGCARFLATGDYPILSTRQRPKFLHPQRDFIVGSVLLRVDEDARREAQARIVIYLHAVMPLR